MQRIAPSSRVLGIRRSSGGSARLPRSRSITWAVPPRWC